MTDEGCENHEMESIQYNKDAGKLYGPDSGFPLPLKQHSSASVVLPAGRQTGAGPDTDREVRPAL